MRWLVLYLRSRQVAVSTAVAVAAVAGLGLLTGGKPVTQLLMTVFAAAVVASVTATGLAGPDPALERTAAVDWRSRRAAHVLAACLLAVVAGVVAGPPAATEVVVRDAIGFTGLAALGVTLLGGGLAWCVPMVWTAVAVSALLTSRPVGAPLVTWPVQPAGTAPAVIAAGVLGVTGLLVYAACGPRAR